MATPVSGRTIPARPDWVPRRGGRARSDLLADPVQDRRGGVGRFGLDDQAVHDVPVVVDVGRLVGVDGAIELLEIHHIRDPDLGEAQQR